MKSSNIHRVTHIQEQCDTWLSTKNRVKTTPKPKKQSKAPGRKSVSSLYEIQWSQTPTDFKATKQTKLLKYMQTKPMKKENLSSDDEDTSLKAATIGCEYSDVMIEKNSKFYRSQDNEHNISYETSPEKENISQSSGILLKDLTPTKHEHLNRQEKTSICDKSVPLIHNKPEQRVIFDDDNNVPLDIKGPKHSQKSDLNYYDFNHDQDEIEDFIVSNNSQTPLLEDNTIDEEEFTFHTQRKETGKRKRHLVDENSQHFCDKIDHEDILVKENSLEFDNDSQLSDLEDFTFHTNVLKDSQNQINKRKKYSKDLNDIDEDFTFHTQHEYS